MESGHSVGRQIEAARHRGRGWNALLAGGLVSVLASTLAAWAAEEHTPPSPAFIVGRLPDAHLLLAVDEQEQSLDGKSTPTRMFSAVAATTFTDDGWDLTSGLPTERLSEAQQQRPDALAKSAGAMFVLRGTVRCQDLRVAVRDGRPVYPVSCAYALELTSHTGWVKPIRFEGHLSRAADQAARSWRQTTFELLRDGAPSALSVLRSALYQQLAVEEATWHGVRIEVDGLEPTDVFAFEQLLQSTRGVIRVTRIGSAPSSEELLAVVDVGTEDLGSALREQRFRGQSLPTSARPDGSLRVECR